MTELYFKVLGPGQVSYHGGSGKWTPGKWRNVRGRLVRCQNGLHYVALAQLVQWLGPEIWAFEPFPGTEVIGDRDKLVCRKGRITEQYIGWNEQSARLFAADCAEHVLPIFERQHPNDSRPREAIAVARKYAAGQVTPSELEVAWDAAQTAAQTTARAATAWAATEATAHAARAAAARDAAWDAARAAAQATARAAERRWQVQRLAEILGVSV